MLGWGIELGGSIVVGGTLGKKFMSLKTSAAACAPEAIAYYSAGCGRPVNFLHLRQLQIILSAVAV
jgi:hypothetical protein